jgi:hypothetical protein
MWIFFNLLSLQVLPLISILLHVPIISGLHLILLYFLSSSDGFWLIEGVVDGPLDADGFGGAFSEDLVEHGFPCELSVVSVSVLDESLASDAVEGDVFDLTPDGEVLVEESDHVLVGLQGVCWQLEVSDEESPAFLVEGANASVILLVSGVSCSAEDVSQIVLIGFIQVLLLRDSVIEPAVDSLGACSSGEVNAEVGGALLLVFVCLGVPGVYLRVALEERRRFLHHLVPVSEVLVIPDVVVVVSFYVGSLFLWLFDLSAGRLLEQLSDFLIPELLEELVLLLKLNIILPQQRVMLWDALILILIVWVWIGLHLLLNLLLNSPFALVVVRCSLDLLESRLLLILVVLIVLRIHDGKVLLLQLVYSHLLPFILFPLLLLLAQLLLPLLLYWDLLLRLLDHWQLCLHREISNDCSFRHFPHCLSCCIVIVIGSLVCLVEVFLIILLHRHLSNLGFLDRLVAFLVGTHF